MEHTDFNILAGKVLLALALVLAVAGQRKAEHGTAMLGFSVFLFGLAARQLENDYLHGWYPHTGWYLVMRLLLAGAALLAFVSLVSERRDRLVAAALALAALAVWTAPKVALAVSRPEPLSSLRPFSTFLLTAGAATLLAALHALLPARIHRLGGAFVLLAALLIVAYVAVDTVDAFSTRMSWTGFGEVGGGPISGMLTLAASVLPLAALSRWKAAPFVPAVTLLLVLLATRGW